MSDLTNLTGLAADELSVDQIQAILAQIDLDVLNLLRDGKLAALKYGVPGEAGRQTDRAANLQALLQAREHYQSLLEHRPDWQVSQAET